MLLLFICFNLSQILSFKPFINIFLEYMIYLTLLGNFKLLCGLNGAKSDLLVSLGSDF